MAWITIVDTRGGKHSFSTDEIATIYETRDCDRMATGIQLKNCHHHINTSESIEALTNRINQAERPPSLMPRSHYDHPEFDDPANLEHHLRETGQDG